LRLKQPITASFPTWSKHINKDISSPKSTHTSPPSPERHSVQLPSSSTSGLKHPSPRASPPPSSQHQSTQPSTSRSRLKQPTTRTLPASLLSSSTSRLKQQPSPRISSPSPPKTPTHPGPAKPWPAGSNKSRLRQSTPAAQSRHHATSGTLNLSKENTFSDSRKPVLKIVNMFSDDD